MAVRQKTKRKLSPRPPGPKLNRDEWNRFLHQFGMRAPHDPCPWDGTKWECPRCDT